MVCSSSVNIEYQSTGIGPSSLLSEIELIRSKQGLLPCSMALYDERTCKKKLEISIKVTNETIWRLLIKNTVVASMSIDEMSIAI